MEKIPCSVGLLTLNSEDSLATCLESLKDFAEVIVCDGNSTDNTRELALRYGAKVISQYDTDEPNTPCNKDKASRRERNMSAATYEWYFFMDADDTLSPEAVEEIRTIVSNPHPKYLVYRMPTRIFIGDKEIKHEATYPSYQTRLVNRSINPHFKGSVHDRLIWDQEKYPVGTLESFYNFYWPLERVRHYSKYLFRYADWEIETSTIYTWKDFLKWGVYRRIRTILGYVLWRLPKMYLRWGFKDSMSLRIELIIVAYHSRILYKETKRFLGLRASIIFIREVLKGKDTNRILSNKSFIGISFVGEILDIGGGGKRASHYRFMDLAKWHKLTTIDISPEAHPDIVMNVENEALPFKDNSFQTVFLFNVLEHLENREKVLQEIRRVLKDGGEFVGIIPFLVNVHPDPNDFVRLTRQGIESLFKEVGFQSVEIKAIGKGPFTAMYYQVEFLIPRIFRFIKIPAVFGLDWLLQRLVKRTNWTEKFPLSYRFIAKK